MSFSIALRLVFGGLRAYKTESVARLGRLFRADIGREDNHRVFEAHRATVTVREYAVLENLKQDVEDIGVSLLDFVEKHHGIRLSAHFFRELSALFEAYQTGGRTYKS